MNGPQILAVIVLYRELLESIKIGKNAYPPNLPLPTLNEKAGGRALEHCHWMLDKIERLVAEGSVEEAFRCLGFVQSVLWREHLFTLEEVLRHYKPAHD